MATFVDVQSNTATSATNVVVTKPTGTTTNDLLIACLANNIGTSFSSGLPSGWAVAAVPSTLKEASSGTLASHSGSAPTGGVTIAWKQAGGSEPANYTFTSASGNQIGVVMAFRGVAFQTPGGIWISRFIFDYAIGHTRSTSTIQWNNSTGAGFTNNFVYSNYLQITALAQNVAATTVNLSALSVGTQRANHALSGVSLLVGTHTFSPSATGVPTQMTCTTDNASGNGRGFCLFIADGTVPNVREFGKVIVQYPVYVMRAYNTVLARHVFWEVPDGPDTTGNFSGFTPGDLADIVIARTEVRTA